MNRSAWLGLLLLWIPAVCALGGPPPAPEPPLDTPAWNVDGGGIDVRSARRDALKQARGYVLVYLQSLYGEFNWHPNDEYLLQTGIATPIGEPQEVMLPVSGKSFKVSMHVQVLPSHLPDVQHHIREDRMAERHRLTALGLAAVVVALLVLMGFLRLDEWTKGYFTTPLAVLALLLAGLAGVGFWWLH
jgi:hypothetical protein